MILNTYPLRRELFTKVHYFIHLNLSITLCLGYIAFVAGIEKATAYEVSIVRVHHDCNTCTCTFIHVQCVYCTMYVILTKVINLQASCIVVAALLHYLFLSVFCWMLCEGIMLYLMLVLVFSKLSKKWWVFLIIGYGELLIINSD